MFYVAVQLFHFGATRYTCKTATDLTGERLSGDSKRMIIIRIGRSPLDTPVSTANTWQLSWSGGRCSMLLCQQQTDDDYQDRAVAAWCSCVNSKRMTIIRIWRSPLEPPVSTANGWRLSGSGGRRSVLLCQQQTDDGYQDRAVAFRCSWQFCIGETCVTRLDQCLHVTIDASIIRTCRIFSRITHEEERSR